MKRIAVSLMFVVCGSYLYAGQDTMGNDRFEVDRSTIIKDESYNILLSSGRCILRRVVVNTPGAAGVTLRLYDGQVDTGTAVAREVIDLTSKQPFQYAHTHSSGVMYGLNGAANVTLEWDWWSGASIPKGFETFGR